MPTAAPAGDTIESAVDACVMRHRVAIAEPGQRGHPRRWEGREVEHDRPGEEDPVLPVEAADHVQDRPGSRRSAGGRTRRRERRRRSTRSRRGFACGSSSALGDASRCRPTSGRTYRATLVQAGRSTSWNAAVDLRSRPAPQLHVIALFFALGGSAYAVGERIQSPAAPQARCAQRHGPRHRRRDRHREPGHREPTRTASRRRRQPLRQEVQLHREGCPGTPRPDRDVRGALRRHLGRKRRRERERRRGCVGPGRPERRLLASSCTPLAATIASTWPSRSSSSESLGQTRRDEGTDGRSRPGAARPRSRRTSQVISLSPGSRPSREPRFW